MLAIKKYIFPVLLMLLYTVTLKAQQSSLPSLLNNQTKKNSDDDEVTALLKQKMFVKVTTNADKVFVGEPVMATYKFYVAMNISDQPTVTKQPEFSGCSVKELNFQQGPEFENINNETYAVYTIRKVQLTPLDSGSLSMGKAFVNNFVQVDNPDDPYVTKKYNISVSNADDAVDVNELPKKNKPADFYGITGTFNITAAVPDAKIPVGENGHLIITIKGSGNLEAINKPEILWPLHVDHFDGTDSQHIDEDNFPISGDRVFDVPFVGTKEGTITIPPIHLSFFNTSTKDYETITTNNIAVVFTKALAKKDEFKNVVNYDISNRKYLWIVPAIAVVVALIGFISYKRNKPKMQPVKPEANITPAPVFEQPQPVYHIRFRTDFSRYLNDLENIKENKSFFEKSKNLLTKAVAERIDSNEYSEQVLLTELIEKTYNAPVCNKVSALYEAINLNLYAPFEMQSDLGFYFNELKQTIAELQAES
jgi:hypothetical protein